MSFRFCFLVWIAAAAGFANTVSASTATVVAGRTARFSVSADGSAPFSYQWFKNNAPIAGAVGNTYVIEAATAADAGTYTVSVSNAAGSTLSDPAVLTVNASDPGGGPPPPPPPPDVASPTPGHLTNLSVRGVAGSDSQTLIVGFIVTGTSPLPVLIRGWGPTLATDPFNVPRSLGDPTLKVFRNGAEVGENDNWGGDPQISAVAVRVGAYPFSPSSRDAAVYTSFAPGGNTAHVVGGSAENGVVLAEVFDGNATYTAGSPRLTNLSARGQVGQGSDVLIGGFIIGGQTPVTVLIRAVGPTLAGFGVTGVLADPKLELHASTGLLEANDNWSDAANASAIADHNARHAFALPSNSKDAAILITLPPGAYSGVIKGANNLTGTALFELYEVTR